MILLGIKIEWVGISARRWKSYVKQGQKIHAIKEYKIHYKSSLVDAKNAVEKYMAKQLTKYAVKKALLFIIKHQGNCVSIACQSCPLYINVEGCPQQENNTKYKIAIEMYVKKFKKDPDLMELLI